MDNLHRDREVIERSRERVSKILISVLRHPAKHTLIAGELC